MQSISDDKNNMELTAVVQEEGRDIGEALENVMKHSGDIGRYQKFLFVCMAPFGIFWSFVYFSQMFITATPQEHWCLVPELGGLDMLLRRSLSIPPHHNSEYDHCRMYDANWTHVLETRLPPDPNTPVVPCQNGWEFLFEDIPYSTIVNEREWVCDKAHFVPWSQTVNFAGSVVGGIICGTLADIYGRLPALIVANLLGFVGGVATIFTTGFWDFSLCRFIVGMSSDSCFLMIYILVMEYVGIKYRSWIANMSVSLYFGGGCVMLPWLALWISNWKHLILATSVPMLIVLATPFVIPESARWLVSKGQVDKAVAIFKTFEWVNKSPIPKHAMDKFVVVAKGHVEKEESVLDLFRNPSIRIILICLIISFMGVAVVFDGLIRLSENLGLDFFVTFTITSATEIPAIAILVILLDKFGRRWLVIGPTVITGVLCLVAAFVPRGVPSVALAVLARFFNNMSYGTVIQWTPELIPTPVRASGASFIHISAFTTVMISPFIVYSDRAWEGLSLIIVGVCALVAAAVATLVPETKGRTMPQTIQEGEQLAKTSLLGKMTGGLVSSPAS